jgi:hypothetical protein
MRGWSVAVLSFVAAIGALLSYVSLYEAAVPTFGPIAAAWFPLLVDGLILGASLQYVAGARAGQPRAGWRMTAHAGVVGTVTLNAMAAPTLTAVPWHVTAPVVWSVLVELTARTVLGEWRAQHRPTLDRVPARLWVTAPVESARVWLRLARRVDGDQAEARLEVAGYAAAVEALRIALPGRDGRTARAILRRQLRAGTLPPQAVLAACGWLDPATATDPAQRVLRAALGAALGQDLVQVEVTVQQGRPEPAPEAEVPGRGIVPVAEVLDPAVQISAARIHAEENCTPVREPEPVSAPLVAPVPRPAPVAAARTTRAATVTERADSAGPRTAEALLPRVWEAIERGHLDVNASAERIRLHLQCAPSTARQLRDALRTT